MQYRANKKQSCKDKESQANFTEYPIFFRLQPLRRKCGRLLENLSRDKELCNWYLTDDAWATFAKEKYELRPASKRKEATITAISDRYWPWMHEKCDGRPRLRQVLPPIRALQDEDANEKAGRCLSGRWIMWYQARVSR